MFIANLAVVELSIALLLFPFSMVTILLQRWALGDAACQFNGATNVTAGAASILTMAVISIDRSQVDPQTSLGTTDSNMGLVHNHWRPPSPWLERVLPHRSQHHV